MPFYVFWPEKKSVMAAGFGKIAHVPCIYDGNWNYSKEPSWFLRDRALGQWPKGSGRKQTRTSLLNYARRLCDFLEWCDIRGKDWKALSYSDVVDDDHGYQNEMLSGRWSVRREPLAPSTVNLRVDQACMFLQWANAHSLRDEFYVPTKTVHLKKASAKSGFGPKPVKTEVRQGKVRANPKSLSLPTDAQVQRWLSAVYINSEFTKGLMSETIIHTAIRREEAVQWRIDTLPLDKSDWKTRGGKVLVEVAYGAKGPKHMTEDGECGPSRTIKIPLQLAEKLHEYRTVRRPVLRAMYVRNAKTEQERRLRMRNKPTRLFLSDFTGEPVSSYSLYTAWKNVSCLPFDEWSPHLGRHYWACKTLVNDVANTYERLRRGEPPPANWATGQAADCIMLQLKPQLGHISPETTQLYLEWIYDVFSDGRLTIEYAMELDSIVANSEPPND